MNRLEQEYYANINGITKALDRIANALESNNKVNEGPFATASDSKIYYKTRRDMYMDNPCTKEEYEAASRENIPGFEGTLDALDDLCNVKKENEELDTQHDYLHGLVQDLDNEAYFEFCNTHCLPASDTVAVSNYITDLDYDEVLGIIKELEEEYPFGGSDDQAYEDEQDRLYTEDIKAQDDKLNGKDGVTYDDDYDLRVTAKMYIAELEAGDFRTKKECILDYVTNEFGSQGARYTDIIKFAYYLNHANGSKFDSTRDRGYYSLGMSGRSAYLTRGGNDFLVKGINKEDNERYFALSHVESVTDYWKYIK